MNEPRHGVEGEPDATIAPSRATMNSLLSGSLVVTRHPVRSWTVQHGEESSDPTAILPDPQTPPSKLTPGTVGSTAQRAREEAEALDGPAFTLRRVVGKGGMGEVWDAWQSSLRRSVAVKTIRDDLWRVVTEDSANRELHRRAFEQEAVVAALLDHPNIVPVYDLGTAEEGGAPLLAMKLARGESWLRILRRDFPEMDAPSLLQKHLPILMDMTQAVAFAHSRGIVHRDLKPHQVMTGAFGETLLMDWGLAVFCGAPGMDVDPSLHLSVAGLPTPETAASPAGTPVLMAPRSRR